MLISGIVFLKVKSEEGQFNIHNIIVRVGTSGNRRCCSPRANIRVPLMISNRQTSNGTWDSRKLHPLK